jgi:hypothetical protein
MNIYTDGPNLEWLNLKFFDFMMNLQGYQIHFFFFWPFWGLNSGPQIW